MAFEEPRATMISWQFSQATKSTVNVEPVAWLTVGLALEIPVGIIPQDLQVMELVRLGTGQGIRLCPDSGRHQTNVEGPIIPRPYALRPG